MKILSMLLLNKNKNNDFLKILFAIRLKICYDRDCIKSMCLFFSSFVKKKSICKEEIATFPQSFIELPCYW